MKESAERLKGERERVWGNGQMRSRVINVRSSGEKEAAFLGRARASNSSGRY